MHKISNSNFGVRVVREGEKYGLEDRLTHNRPEPMVEFYDVRWANTKGFGPRGQFVSRYDLAVFESVRGGLALDLGIPAWTLSAREVAEAKAYVAGLLTGSEGLVCGNGRFVAEQ